MEVSGSCVDAGLPLRELLCFPEALVCDAWAQLLGILLVLGRSPEDAQQWLSCGDCPRDTFQAEGDRAEGC